MEVDQAMHAAHPGTFWWEYFELKGVLCFLLHRLRPDVRRSCRSMWLFSGAFFVGIAPGATGS